MGSHQWEFRDILSIRYSELLVRDLDRHRCEIRDKNILSIGYFELSRNLDMQMGFHQCEFIDDE